MLRARTILDSKYLFSSFIIRLVSASFRYSRLRALNLARLSKIVMDSHGSYLGMEKGCFIVKDRHENVERYPLFGKEIGEVILKSGNMVSTGALSSLGFWGIDVLVCTQRGRPVAMLKSLER